MKSFGKLIVNREMRDVLKLPHIASLALLPMSIAMNGVIRACKGRILFL